MKWRNGTANRAATKSVTTAETPPHILAERTPTARFRLAGPRRSKSPRAEFAEAYRLLAVQLRPVIRQRNVRSLLIMGAYPGDGRTTLVANLGLALAETGTSVVLLDADTHHSSLAQVFPEAERTSSSESLHGLRVISGPPRDLILWEPARADGRPDSAPSFESAISAALQYADMALIDSPPCLVSSEAFSLAAMVDAVLFVVRRRRQDVDAQRSVQEQLTRLGVTVLGAVFNEA